MHRRVPAFARATRAAAVGTLAAIVLAGCGGSDDESALAEADGTIPASASASASPTPSPSSSVSSAATAGDEPPAEGVQLGRSPATSDEESAVVDVTLAYWQQVYAMYATADVDRDAFAAVARGPAYQGPLNYVAVLQRNDVRQKGGAIMGVEKLEVDGRTGEVVACFRNDAVNVDDRDRPAEPLMPFFVVRNIVQKQGPDWRVTRSITLSENARCEFR